MKPARVSLVLVIIVLLSFCACAAKAKAPVKPPAPPVPKDTTMAQIHLQVEVYKPNIIELFETHSKDKEMKGLVSITLYLTDDGFVALSDVNPIRGNLSNSFLIALEDMTNEWTFTQSKRVAYSFTMNLE